MFSICLRYTRCNDDAQDVLQEAFIKIYNNRDKFDPERHIGAWIKTITIRAALNYIKDQSRYSLTDDEAVFDQPVEETVSINDQVELKNKLMIVLNRLPDGYKMVFNLYAVDNLTHKEIAEYLNISEGTSKSQYSKAKKMIRELLNSEKLAS